jgi:hypothetical protein
MRVHYAKPLLKLGYSLTVKGESTDEIIVLIFQRRVIILRLIL